MRKPLHITLAGACLLGVTAAPVVRAAPAPRAVPADRLKKQGGGEAERPAEGLVPRLTEEEQARIVPLGNSWFAPGTPAPINPFLMAGEQLPLPLQQTSRAPPPGPTAPANRPPGASGK